ncbi:tRNA pseudouridine(55) synthase TruB [Candidatus Babeliales bacterium]|nr:tRNA pseudouridine(55) synthase TruB [Candidatus Babeliales bacterium]
MQNETIHGFLVLNKPKGAISFDCIRVLKKFFPKKTKIGHTGTLDDVAQGLLIICIGKEATRCSGAIMNVRKEYEVTAKLGELTDSLDAMGKVLETHEAGHVTRADLEGALAQLGTSYLQTPPIYSALKHEGKPLYKLARRELLAPEALEEIIQTKKRVVQLYETQLLDFNKPYFSLRACVSKGTYVRSLAHDLAGKLGLPATTYELIRTGIGGITLRDAVELDALKSHEDVVSKLLTIEEMTGKLGFE